MNAIELADLIKEWGFELANKDVDAIETMLRQQAKRIEELEHCLIVEQEHNEMLQTKPCNGFCGEQECKENQKNCERARMARKLLGSGTPQTKPLSDEEIKQIWYNLYPLSSSSYWDDKREGLAELKFARAIIKEMNR